MWSYYNSNMTTTPSVKDATDIELLNMTSPEAVEELRARGCMVGSCGTVFSFVDEDHRANFEARGWTLYTTEDVL